MASMPAGPMDIQTAAQLVVIYGERLSIVRYATGQPYHPVLPP